MMLLPTMLLLLPEGVSVAVSMDGSPAPMGRAIRRIPFWDAIFSEVVMVVVKQRRRRPQNICPERYGVGADRQKKENAAALEIRNTQRGGWMGRV